MQRTKRMAMILMACLLIFSTIALPVAGSSSQTAIELNQAKATRDAYNARLEQARAQQQALSGQTNQASADLAWIQQRSAEQQETLAALIQQKNDALMVMAQTADDYAFAIEQLDLKKEQYASRLRVMFDYTGQSMFEVFLESETLQSFFTTIEFMKLISEADEQMIAELTLAREEADLRKEEAEAAAADMELLVAEADAALAEIQQNELLTNARLYELNSQLASANNEATAWANEAAAISNQVASLESQYNSQIQAEYAAEQARQEAIRQQQAQQQQQQQQQQQPQAPSTGGSGFAWPLPGYYGISSSYGYRSFLGGQFHGGIDLPAPTGTPIVAASAGVVVMAQIYGTYGNFIAISHGNGIQTYYGHMSGYAVTAGQSVARGQVIGYVGSTGRSTGPHLHFEVLVNGGTRNPMSFY